MKVVMLAAGIGARLGQTTAETVPKVLLRFDGKSLLERHIDIFRRQEISELVLGVGFQHDDIQREIETLGAQSFARTVFNKDYDQGSIVTLSTLRDEICCGEPVLLMDADVLYMMNVWWNVSSIPGIRIVCLSIVLLCLAMSLSKYVFAMARLSSFANG